MERSLETFNFAQRVVEFFAQLLFFITVGLTILINDVPANRQPVFFYEHKILGLDPLDWLTLFLVLVTGIYLLMRNKITLTKFHKYILIIMFIYGLAMVNGFIYGIFYNYPFSRWVQDFQRPLYLSIYFFITYELLSDEKKWKRFWYFLFLVVSVKVLTIAIDTLSQKNWWLNLGHRWTVTTYGTDLVILSLIFSVPVSFLFLAQRIELPKRLIFIFLIILYLFVTLAGQGRTIIVLIMVTTAYMVTELKARTRLKFFLFIVVAIAVFLLLFNYLQPKFFARFQRHFATIFNLAVSMENLSNATRVMEIKNIVHRLFAHASLLQGMGLGAWWDDQVYRLPPFDFGSGFIGSKIYFHTHLLFLSQLLQLGLIGTFIFWFLIFKMFIFTRNIFAKMPDGHPQKALLLGLNVVYINFVLCMANYLRVFFFIGLFLAIIARLLTFLKNEVA